MDPLTPDQKLNALAAQVQGGAYPDLEGAGEGNPADQPDTDPDAFLPGRGEQLPLGVEGRVALGIQFADLLDRYDNCMQARNEMEEDIGDAYDLIPDEASGGISPDSESLVSPLLMSVVDQCSARITSNMMQVKPLMRVIPVVSAESSDKESEEFAESTENFLQNYLYRVMGVRYFLPLAVTRACKVGTAVLMPSWEERPVITYSYTKEGTLEKKEGVEGRVKVELIPNRNMVIWPPTIPYWQDGYEFVGHRAYYSTSQWRALAKSLNISDEVRELIEATELGQNSGSDAQSRKLENQGISPQNVVQQLGQIKLTQLYCNMILPDETQPSKFMAIFHEASRSVLWVSENPLHCQRHAYHPIRYKLVDESSWGNGIGHEILYEQAKMSTLTNLEMDNMMSSGYNVLLYKAGIMSATLTDKMMPGQMIPVDNKDDITPISLGKEVEGLGAAQERTQQMAYLATGQPPVLAGQGDPTMKSGAGTGSTIALIEQAGKKFGQVDATMRTDWSDFAYHVMELIAQYATDGVYYRYADPADAGKLHLLKYVPPRGSVSDQFHIYAQAPDAATSEEARRQNYFMIWNFLIQSMQPVAGLVQQVAAQNPNELQRYANDQLGFLHYLMQQIMEYADVPDVAQRMPAPPQPIPEDQQIQQLQGQLQQMQQAMQAQQQPPAQGGPPGAPPPGPPQGQPPGPPPQPGMGMPS